MNIVQLRIIIILWIFYLLSFQHCLYRFPFLNYLPHTEQTYEKQSSKGYQVSKMGLEYCGQDGITMNIQQSTMETKLKLVTHSIAMPAFGEK